MRASTAQLRKVLARGSFDSHWTCDVFYDGQRIYQDMPVRDVQMDEDGTAKIQQSGSLTIIWQDPRGRSIAPESIEDVLSPFGTQLILYQIISDGPLFVERVPMGTFVISDVPSLSSVPWSFHGRALVKGDQIKVTFKDPFYKVSRNRFDIPGITPSLSSVYAEIQRLTRLPVTLNPAVPDGPIPRAMVYEEDRLDAVYELGGILDATPYMLSDGTVSLRPNAWGGAVDEIAAANAGDEVRELSPASYTAWVEEQRNLSVNPRAEAAGLGWSSNNGTLYPLAKGVTPPIAHPLGIATAAQASTTGTNSTLASIYNADGLGNSGTPQRYLGIWVLITEPGYRMSAGASGLTWPADELPVNVWTYVRSLTPVAAGGYATAYVVKISGTASTTVRAYLTGGIAPSGGAPVGDYFDGALSPGGGLRRTRWLGTAQRSASVIETRDLIPAVLGPDIPRRGTLVRVSRGMSAEGVYNRVVVRAQGQKAGVLAAGEIGDGPLRAENVDGEDSPFGRVPYFMSSQFITSPAQARTEVAKWLPRVSRPQALIMDIDELVNPLREVGDVVTVRRKGDVFPARVVKVGRTSDKTQTTSVMVVPSA